MARTKAAKAAPAPADELWCSGWHVTMTQLRQVAAGTLPPEWVAWAQEDLEFFALPPGEFHTRQLARQRARKKQR